MSDTRKYAAVKLTRASIGKSSGTTTLDVAAIQDRLGNTLTMTNFGSKGFGVLSPGKTNERQFVFTGITGSQITGISEVTMTDPYTESSGWSRAVIAGESVVLATNSPAFYNEFVNVENDNTFTGKQLFTTADRPALTTDADTSTDVDLVTYGQLSRVAISGGVNASLTEQGLVELPTAAEVDAGTATGGTGAAIAVTPDKLRARRYLGYYVDAGANDTYAVTGVSATLAAGDRILVNINTANTGAATLSVDGGSNIAIVKDKSAALETGDLVADQILDLIYDGTNWQLLSPVAQLSAANKAILTGGVSSNADALHTHNIFPAFQQINTGLPATLNCGQAAYDAATGNFYLALKTTAGTSFNIYRFAIGTYSKTWQKDTVTVSSSSFDGVANGGLMVGATYVWLVGRATGGSDIRIVRFAKDLTGAQVMTISGTANTDTQVSVTGDDSTLYVKSATSSTRLAVYNISGTTATRASDISLTSGGDDMCISDGSKFYSFASGSPSSFRRYALTGGAAEATIARHLAEADNLAINNGNGMSLIGFNSYDTNRFITFLIHLEELGTTDQYIIDALLVDKT